MPQTDWLLRLWCAKEAVAKALGLGLRGNPLNYIIRRIDIRKRRVVVESRAASRVPTLHTAHVGSDHGMAFAVAQTS